MQKLKHLLFTVALLLFGIMIPEQLYSKTSDLTGVDYTYVYCSTSGQLFSLWKAAGYPSNLKVGGYISGKDFEDLYNTMEDYEDPVCYVNKIENLDLSDATILEYTSSRHKCFSTKANQLVWNFIEGGSYARLALSTLVLPDNCEYFYTEYVYKSYTYDYKCQSIGAVYTNSSLPFGMVYGYDKGILYVPEGSKNKWIEQLKNGNNFCQDNLLNTCMVVDTQEKIVNGSFSLTITEIANVDILTINCDISAKDFVTLNNMPQLCKLTINGNILAYTGSYGPIYGVYTSYPANEVPKKAFANNQTLQCVWLDKCNNYGDYCFQNATNLRSVVKYFGLADHTSIVGNYAFDGCVNLSVLDNKWHNYNIGFSSIGDFAFRNTQLKDVRLSSYTIDYSWEEYEYDSYYRTFKHIGKNPFFGVRTKHGIKYGYKCYRNDDGDGDNKGEYTYNWGSYSDSEHPGQHEISLGNKLCAYAYSPYFSGTRASEYTMGGNITEVADWAISDVYMHGLTISENLEKIGEAFLYKCTDLTYIEGSSSEFTTIESVLYTSDKKTLIKYPAAHPQTEFHITEDVKKIDTWAFESVKNLKTLYVHSVNPLELGDNVFEDVDLSLLTLYVPFEGCELYRTAAVWKEFGNIRPINPSGTCGDNLTWRLTEGGELIIEGTGAMNDFSYGAAPWYKYRESIKAVTISEGVTSIGRYACLNCNKLVEVVIPESVDVIGERAFEGCLLLPSVSIPNAVAEVGDAVFKDCYKLVSANLPEDIAYIPDWCFYNCTSLVAITIPEKVMSIGESSFINCMSLTNTHIPEGVTSIGDYAFNNCRSFTSVVIPDGVTAINDGVFQSCVNLASVVIPDGVVSIGSWAFYDCGVLTSVSIPESVTSIGKMAFYDCNAITAINIPEGVTEIGESVFYRCYNLASITIPESVTSIGSDAFSVCNGLTAITSEAITPPVVIQGAFSGVNKSIPLYVPAGSVAAYKSAQYWNEFTNILPLPITITINQYGSGTYSSPYALDFREVKGLYAYAATGYNSDDNVVTFTRVKTAKAGTGLFIKGAPNTSYEVPILESTADNTLNMLVATLEKTNVDKYSSDGLYANYKYTLAPDDTELMFHPFANGSSLSAGKAYLQIPVAWLPGNDARSIRFRFDDGDGEDVDDGTTEMDNTEFGIQNSEIIYDLTGRRVASPQRGSLYIINGKKVIY